MKRYIMILGFVLGGVAVFAQTYIPNANPAIAYFSKENNETDTIYGGESFSEEAPLTIYCLANMVNEDEFTCYYDWQLRKIENGRANLQIRRNERDTEFSLTESGTYNVKFSVSCYYNGQKMYDIDDLDSITFTIPESSLTCPDGISPNGDDRNDYLILSYKSIVRMEAMIFNRWGKKVASCNYEQAVQHEKSTTGRLCIWDGYIGGKVAKDGVYFLNLVAEGSDGVVYKIKKAINVLKGYKENNETDGNTEN
ncbi:MAG: gliding motility-associated C-terminal domain-containing protein [Bacteroidaceae bacterium]|nr:gliding motility-associated C-terminal domain-containing protein [Bacteroidaceae bacterium]